MEGADAVVFKTSLYIGAKAILESSKVLLWYDENEINRNDEQRRRRNRCNRRKPRLDILES